MARRTSSPLPRVERILVELGQNIRLARTRRKLPAELVAERAGMSRPTLRSIERGDGGVTIGAIANVLNSLGLVDDLAGIARDDVLGRKLEDAQLQAKQRVRRGTSST
jgi:transcriptional regulator with XRE-family HTH domain